MKKTFEKIKSVTGELNFSGDKSISHRAVFFSSMAEGKSLIKNISLSDDVKSTQSVFEELGVQFKNKNSELIIVGKGKRKFDKPIKPLYCGNSGTTARLLSGLLIAQNFPSLITGDESLSNRPMQRVVEPLSLMGAKIFSSDGKLPLKFEPSSGLKSINYDLVIPSAQVKSAVIIAGLHLNEITTINERFLTRDHTERMLGLKVEKVNDIRVIYASDEHYPKPSEYFIPGDISSSAFFIVLALLLKNSELIIRDISLNPTRTGFIEVLKKMNARIFVENVKNSNNEPYGDLIVKSSELKNVEINDQIIPNIIDEIPVLAIAGVFAEGRFKIRNCRELRYKESDRIKSICENLRLTGLEVEEYADGFCIDGEMKKNNITFSSYNDHRIAMAFTILSLLSGKNYSVDSVECVGISNPEFFNQLKMISN